MTTRSVFDFIPFTVGVVAVVLARLSDRETYALEWGLLAFGAIFLLDGVMRLRGEVVLLLAVAATVFGGIATLAAAANTISADCSAGRQVSPQMTLANCVSDEGNEFNCSQYELSWQARLYRCSSGNPGINPVEALEGGTIRQPVWRWELGTLWWGPILAGSIWLVIGLRRVGERIGAW